MAARPLVSVLLPCRDTAATMAVCLESIVRQTLGDWECVLVDDGSRDDTAAVAGEFARRDSRFRLLRQPRRGLVAALNLGLSDCRGELIARMDADDVMHRRRLELQLEVLDDAPHLAAVGSHVHMFPGAAVGRGMAEYRDWLNGIRSAEDVRREAFVECPVAHPTLMIRRAAIPSGGYREVDWPEDYDLVLRILQQGQDLGVVARRLLAWRRDAEQLSRSHPRYAISRFVACKAHYLASGFLRETERYQLSGYGNTGRALCRALLLHGKHPSHVIELHPGRLGNRIQGASVIAPDQLATVPRLPMLVSVAGSGPRAEIRAACRALGLIELRDFVCAA